MTIRARHLLLAVITAIALSLLAPLPAQAATTTIQVRLTNAAGAAVTSGVKVEVSGGGYSDPAVSDGAGTYTASAEFGGSVNVVVTETNAQGLYDEVWLWDQPAVVGGTTTIDVQLETFTGIVVTTKDATSGAALPQITVAADPTTPPAPGSGGGMGGGMGGGHGTNANGRVAIPLPTGQQYYVCGYDDDYNSNNTPVYRYQDTCWTADGRYAATPGAADAVDLTTTGRQVITLTMPRAGLSLDPEQAFIHGTPSVGSTLRVDTGSWEPADTAFSYSWVGYDQAGVRSVLGSGPTLAVPSSADGKEIFVEVTGSKAGYATHSESDWGGVIGSPNATLSSPLAITGTAQVGETLQATHGTASTGSDLDYTWLVGGKIIPDWDAYLTLTEDMVGQRISVRVQTRDYYENRVNDVQAFASGPVVQGVFDAPTPAISGTPAVGSTLTATTGTWSPAPDAYAYQWYAGGVAISGATTSTYTPTAAEQGKTITVRVTGSKTGYVSSSVTSAATSAVLGAFTAPAPTISGTRAVGYTLTAVTGTWSPAPTSFTYQWYRAGVAISGATGSTYKLTTYDQGKTITVKVTGVRSGYATTSRTSAATAAILGVFTTAPTPTITGTRKVGYSLTANPGTWSPTPSSFTYQWYRVTTGGTVSAISGATAKTYKLTSYDKGRYVYVRVTGIRSGYLSKAVNSAKTGLIG